MSPSVSLRSQRQAFCTPPMAPARLPKLTERLLERFRQALRPHYRIVLSARRFIRGDGVAYAQCRPVCVLCLRAV